MPVNYYEVLSEEKNTLLSRTSDKITVLSPLKEDQKKQIDNKLVKFRAKLDEVNFTINILIMYSPKVW